MSRAAARRKLVDAWGTARTLAWRLRHQPRGEDRTLAALPVGSHFHLGCGDERLPDRINVDIRYTPGVDVVADLSRPRLRSAGSVVSHAFFEHVYRNDRESHLRALRDALVPNGWVLYMGLPDFRTIAGLYLGRAPGIIGPRFDLFNVYRYTHGDPEHAEGWWLAQLHKSLFDRDELETLLRASGFGSFVIANYAFKGEPHALNLAFYARRDGAADPEAALAELGRFSHYVDLHSVSWDQ